jgi:RNA polymerase sigma factor (sigma-70 family)
MPSTTSRDATRSRESRVHTLATDLLAERGEHLLNLARRHSRNRDDAEEALQEAFIIFIRKFDPDDEAPPLPWLIVTLKRECWARRRRHGCEQPVPPCYGESEDENAFALEAIPDFRHGPAEASELAARAAEIRERFVQLKPDHRRCLSLKALGYSYDEIAEITGWTYTKINRCMVEGRAHLRRLGPA